MQRNIFFTHLHLLISYWQAQVSRKNAGLYGGRVFESRHTHLKVLTVVSDSQRSNAKKQRFFRFFRAVKVESVQTFKSAKFLSKNVPVN